MVRKSFDKKTGKEKRSYMGWEDASKVEWRVEKEYEGKKNWEARWGHPNPWMKRYEKWICSDMKRAMRKPSFRAIEWKAWQDKCGGETAYQSECRTRPRRKSIRDFFIEPLPRNMCCCPGPWPKTTYGEIGYLGRHKGCHLEIYPNDFMKRPRLPWYIPSIDTYLSNSQ